MNFRIFFLFFLLFSTKLFAQNWNIIPTGINNFLFDVSIADNSTIYTCSKDSVLLKSTDFGNSFTLLNTSFLPFNFKFGGIKFTEKNTGFVYANSGTSTGNVYKTIDGGSTWNLSLTLLGQYISSLEFPSPRIGYIISDSINNMGTTTYYSFIYKTIDSGNTWFQLYAAPSNYLCNKLQMIDTMNGVFYTQDYSVSWPIPKFGRITNGNTINYIAGNGFYTGELFFPTIDTGFIYGQDQLGYTDLSKTNNGGSNWSSIFTYSFPAPIYIQKLFFLNAKKGFRTQNTPIIASTTNGGGSWSLSSYNSTKTPYALDIKSNLAGFCVGDSGLILKLSLCQPSYDTVLIQACDSFILNGNKYSNSVVISDTILNYTGCDSIIRYDININYHKDTIITVPASCMSVNLNGQLINSSKTVLDTFTLITGCDSVVKYFITIDTLVNANILISNDSLIAFPSAMSYQWYSNCPVYNTIPFANNQYYNVISNDNYAVTITNGTCVDTSDCISIINLSNLNIKNNSGILIEPNITSGVFTIFNDELNKHSEINILSSTGQIIFINSNIHTKQYQIDLSNYPTGIYFVRIKNDNNSIKNFKLFKN